MRTIIGPVRTLTYLGLLLPYVSVSLATDYYVSPSGSDGNAGTQAAPWATISRVNAQSFLAGDRIFFQGNQTFAGNLSFAPDDAGAATAPIIVNSYGTGRATILSGAGTGIQIYNTAGIKIQNLIISGGSRSSNPNGRGIYLLNELAGNVKLDFVSIDNVDVADFGLEGAAIYGLAGSSGWKNIEITNSRFYRNQDGIQTYAVAPNCHQNIFIRSCSAYSNDGTSGKTNPTGTGVVLGQVDGGLIERCVAYANGSLNTNVAGPVGVWCYDSNNILIQHNESYGNKCGSGRDGDGFDLDQNVSNSTIQYNYSHGNDGAGYLLSNGSSTTVFGGNIVRYNISENDGRKNSHAGIECYGNVRNTDVYQNTVYISPAASGTPCAIKVTTYTGVGTVNGLRFRNNIVYVSGALPLVSVDSRQASQGIGLVFQGNDYWRADGTFSLSYGGTAYTSLSSWRTATGQEKNGAVNTGLNADPMLAAPGGGGTIGDAQLLSTLSAYKLQAGSPMIDAALDLGALFGIDPGSQDFYGAALPQGGIFDIGAHEVLAGGITVDLIGDNAVGESWNTGDDWSNGLPAAGGNGYRVGNAAGKTLRTPTSGSTVFPGASLTISNTGALVLKVGTSTVNNLRLDGGRVLNGDNNATRTINGSIAVVGSSFIESGYGAADARDLNVGAAISGSGALTVRGYNTGNVVTLTSGTNTYTGNWTVQAAFLDGQGANSLGSGNITVNAGARLDADYNINSTSSLVLNGVMDLDQNHTFRSVTINGSSLPAGTYDFATLNAAYNVSFTDGGSGSITVAPSINLIGDNASGESWNLGADWSNGLPAAAGNGYHVGNSTGKTLRTPASGSPVFPGNSLTIYTTGALVLKVGTSTINNLRLDGGRVANGDNLTRTINGNIAVVSDSFLDSGYGATDGRDLNVAAAISGSANLTIRGYSTGNVINLTSTASTYAGHWTVQAAFLDGQGANSLGSGNITVSTGARLDADYNINNSSSMLILNGIMDLDQNHTFRAMTINGVNLSAGTYSFATLNSNYNANFTDGGSGSITVTQGF